MDSEDVAQALRVLSLALGVILFGLTAGVLHSYFIVWKKVRKSATGILPFHVWTIALSHCLAIGFMAADVFTLIGNHTDLTWRGPLFIVSSCLGIASLVSVLRFELRRKRNLLREQA